MIEREIGIRRLSSPYVDIRDKYYLHLRNLFDDIKSASEHASGRMLDVGCGNKPYAEFFRQVVTDHIGQDIVQSSDVKVDVVSAATCIPLSSDSFDTILCTQVIEHVDDHRALISECNRLLKTDGKIILTGPMYWPLHEEPHDYFRFTEYGLRYLLEINGFSVLYIKTNGGKWALCGQVIIHTLQNTIFWRSWVIALVNRWFGWLDNKYPDFSNPMNYIVVACKNKNI